MKKTCFLLIFCLVLIQLVSGINLNVKKLSVDEVMIAGLNEPVIFELELKNTGTADNIEFYNLLGFQMFPVGTFFIGEGQTKKIKLELSPIGEFNYRGAYTFNYFIKSQDFSEKEEKLTFKVVDLKDVFEIGASDVNNDLNSIKIYIHNKVNFDFEDINVKFSSVFFDFEESFSLSPNKRKDFDVQLNNEDFNKLMAGFYTMDAEVSVKNQKANFETTIKFAEKDILTTSKEDYGFVINTQVIEKTNEGNILANSEIIIEKNIFSRLFTTLSPQPDIVERAGFKIFYTWSKEIKPGEKIVIIVKTNWLFPFLAVFLILVIVVLTKQYSKTHLVLRKKVSFVNAKGGEFALKVMIFVNAKKYIERVNIIDRLPMFVKIYERFGTEKPSRVNEKTRRIEWNFEKLEVGEVRVLSYIIYSKLGILGKFALPTATAIYERDGKINESESNKAFFVTEQKKEKIEEED